MGYGHFIFTGCYTRALRLVSGLTQRLPDMVSVFRLALAGGAGLWMVYVESADVAVVVALFALSRLLDLADGYLARRFSITTQSGSVLDLVADLGTHAILWWVSGLWFAWGLILVEWSAGIGILLVSVSKVKSWKGALTANGPNWILAYFRSNQRNVLCGYASVCHFLVPAGAILSVPSFVLALTIPGLMVYEAATVYLLVTSWTRVLSTWKDEA